MGKHNGFKWTERGEGGGGVVLKIPDVKINTAQI